jgi:hypothetical protein
VKDYKQLFDKWLHHTDVRKWGVVYRVEVQERGALHWHCMVVKPGHKSRLLENRETNAGYGAFEIFASWVCVVDETFPMVQYDKPVPVPSPDPGEYSKAVSGPLSWWRGATTCRRTGCYCGGTGHMITIEYQDHGRNSWYRYMADHATKVKRNQIASDIGRHWGVNGRSHFPKFQGEKVDLTVSEYHKFRRMYERLATHRVLDERCIGGKRLGRRPKRGRYGTSQAFMNPGTRDRLLSFVTSTR